MIPLRFTAADADRAFDAWGSNCGPGSLAAVLGKTLDEIRPHLGDFERKGYMNPTMVMAALWNAAAPATIEKLKPNRQCWPAHGLARVQWEGPWTKPGVPARVAYNYTHWVAARRDRDDVIVFDINAMDLGGWLPLRDWRGIIVPRLLAQVARSTGWHLTHVVELDLKRIAA